MLHSLYEPVPAPLGLGTRTRPAIAHRLMVCIVMAVLLLGPVLPGDAVARSVKQRVKQAKRESGYASWYGPGFLHRRTATGEWFDPKEMAAAHRTLPFGTRVRVTNLENGRRIVVRINDRGPYKKGRVIDVTPAVAKRLGFKRDGLTRVRVDVLKRPKHELRYAEEEPRDPVKRKSTKKASGRA